MSHAAELAAIREMLANMYRRVRAIEDDTPMATAACGHLGDALTHIESAKGDIGAARTAMEEGR